MSIFEKISYWAAWIIGAALLSSYFADAAMYIFVIAIFLAIVLKDKYYFHREMKNKAKEARKEYKKAQKEKAKQSHDNPQ